MTKILTKEAAEVKLAKKRRHIMAVYFASGIMLPMPTCGYHYQTSSASKAVTYVCMQNPRRL